MAEKDSKCVPVNEHSLEQWKSPQASNKKASLAIFSPSYTSIRKISEEAEPASLTPTYQPVLYKANLANLNVCVLAELN